MSENEFDILIAKYFTGEMEESEKELLGAYLEKEGYRKEFDLARRAWDASLKGIEIPEFDEDAAWTEFQTRWGATRRKRSWNMELRIAAGVALVACLITLFMFVMPGEPARPILANIPVNRDLVSSEPRTPVIADEPSIAEPVRNLASRITKTQVEPAITYQTVNSGDSARLCILPDNSIIYLNVHSSVTYPSKFTSYDRSVVLEGEAYFDISDETTPFLVHCSRAVASLKGKNFNIKNAVRDQLVEVTVIAGTADFIVNGNGITKRYSAKSGQTIHCSLKNDKVKQYVTSKKAGWWEKGGLRQRIKDFFNRILGKK